MTAFAQTIRRVGTGTWILAPLAAAVAIAVLIGAVSIGLRLRSTTEASAPLPHSEPLDYGAPFGVLSPLSAFYIESVLGGVIDVPARVGERSRLPAGAGTREAIGGRRVEVRHPFTNDDRADAIDVPRVPYTARTDTRRATRESGETRSCAPSGGTVWYRFTAPADTGLIANTFGSNYSTVLGVFRGQTSVGCDTDLQGNAIVQFVARKHVTYLFQITGPAGGGDFVFSLDPTGVTRLESVSNSGRRAEGSAADASISADGRFVAFQSDAENLVRSRTYGGSPAEGGFDIFVRDRAQKTTELISVSSTGAPGNDLSELPFISGNGRYVAFESWASNLVKGDTNGRPDVFVRDLISQTTQRVSVSSSGAEEKEDSPVEWGTGAPDRATTPDEGMLPSMSYDGRYVAFASTASNLVAGDHNHVYDVFVHDRVTGRTERVSVDSSGRERGPEEAAVKVANDAFMSPAISANGRFVSFRTSAGNLVSDDDNRSQDLFVHDRVTRRTERITKAPLPGNVADDDQPYYVQNEAAARQALSYDGRYVAFSASPRPTAGPLEAHVFVYDRRTGRMQQADLSSTGQHAEDGQAARGGALSADGRYVAFHSSASNLVPGDDNGADDVFVRDLKTGTTTRLTGELAVPNGPCRDCGSGFASMSADGRIVAFESAIVNPVVVPDTSNDQIYVTERATANP